MTRSFESREVRDLVWALTSPALLHHRLVVTPNRARRAVRKYSGLLRQLDDPGSALARAVRRRKSSRLGEYFETLVTTWIDELPPAHLRGANVQVHAGEGTVGEFDLVFEQDRTVHHWELAIKFYLGYPGPSGPIWYGPNPKDVLREKWKKMRKQQLRLSEHPAAKAALHRMGVHGAVRPGAFIKGYLYEALEPRYSTHHHPHANRDGLRGWWVHRGALGEVRPPGEEDVRWLRLGRLRWMSEVAVDSDDRLATTVAELVRDDSPSRPAHVAGVTEDDDGELVEVSRGFVVPDGWPST